MSASEVKETILLVDDSEVNLEMWSLFLQHQGFRVLCARDGIEALKVVREETVDLVLLDIVMPGISGLEVLTALRDRHPPHELPVIMATARDESEDMVRAFKMGANDYVTKPLDMDVVAVRIRAQLRARVPRQGGVQVTDGVTSITDVQPGTVLDGKYRLESLIGHGNFGAVYRASHLTLERSVAIKLLNTAVAAGDTAGKRFQQEGISTCRIQHPNAVSVLDFSVTSGGIPFLVMELLNGHALDIEIETDGPLSPMRCAEILLPVCEVLAEAHALGIIHRDVKPQNVFLHRSRRGEVVKVLDFGIAKMVGQSTLDQRLTAEGSTMGTPAYMAPERLSDEPYGGRADVYSLGVTLYEMLAGRLPFVAINGGLFELIRMHLHEPPRPLSELCPDLPPQVEAVVLQALAKRPRDRPGAATLGCRFAAALDLPPPASLQADFERRPSEEPATEPELDLGDDSLPATWPQVPESE